MPKENLKDKLEGNELDLSLSNLTTVPVKELVSTAGSAICVLLSVLNFNVNVSLTWSLY